MVIVIGNFNHVEGALIGLILELLQLIAILFGCDLLQRADVLTSLEVYPAAVICQEENSLGCPLMAFCSSISVVLRWVLQAFEAVYVVLNTDAN
jgi:hypothetical protein